ncbi:XdhC family protein [Microbacterium rhizomatis]|uniref:XdhC family protein n=1 Tax=Microbacterium rhizomatis TaxID=1631477 RepID=A0A5J5IY23_9MICO|nr:XdhC/CoxI family protein [Microbacterium rhizomatis]KAA9106401.1 XdhC family protein [Microbacterium rhizomatis]
MLELAPELLPVLRAGSAVAVVTIIGVPRSAPLGVGASMAVTADGRVIGSISGGCVEGDAVLLSHAVLRDGVGRTARFGFTDEAASAAGLACGGAIDVVVYRIDPTDAAALSALALAAADRRVAMGVTCGDRDPGRILPAEVLPDRSMEVADSRMLPAAYDGSDLLVLTHRPRPRLIIAGAGDHAAALCRVATAAGFAVSVCDPWELLVTRERFPDAERLVAGLPHEYLRSIPADELDERTAVCVLTHDERIDVPALRAALALPIGFVGAMGSRSTVARRAQLLRQSGVDEDDLARLHSPLGLDLQGTTPDETAIAVLAEIVAARRHGTGLPLRDLSSAVHRSTGEVDRSCSPALTSEARR